MDRAERIRGLIRDMRASLDTAEIALSNGDWAQVSEDAVSLTDDATAMEQYADDQQKAGV